MKRTAYWTDGDAEKSPTLDPGRVTSDPLDTIDDTASRDRTLSPDEQRRVRAAELRSEAAALDGADLSEEDFHMMNGGGPTDRLHAAVWKLPHMTEREIGAARRQQRISYKGLAAVDELERARARCMILLETAATGAFHKAAEDNTDIGTRQAYVDLALRCLEGLNKMSDRFERARGQAQQQIFVQHNRFDNGSRAVLQTVQTERLEPRSGLPPLLSGAQPANGETPSAVEESPPPHSAKRRKRDVGATP